MTSEYVFVYNELCATASRIEGCAFVGHGRTVSMDYQLVAQDGTCIMLPTVPGRGINIVGDVYKCTPYAVNMIRNAIEQRQYHLECRKGLSSNVFPKMQAKKLVVKLDNRTINAIVYYRSDDARLTGLPMIPSGEWNAKINQPLFGPPRVLPMHDCDFEFECHQCNRVIGHDDAIDVDGNPFCIACASDLDDAVAQAGQVHSDEETDDEDDSELEGDPVFTLNDNKIFVTTDFGESYGPFDTVMEAIGAIQEEMCGVLSDVRTLTVGFRLVRDGLSETAQDELEAGTIPF